MYQMLLSPWFGGNCLFKVSCSQAVLESAQKGGYLAAWRLFKYRYKYCRNTYRLVYVDGKNAILYPDGHLIYSDNLSIFR